MGVFLNTAFLATVISHLMVDTLNGQRAVLFTFFSEQLGLTNAQLGIFSTVYILAASLIQPVFGYMSDRLGPRWLVSGGLLWMGLFYSLGILTPGVAGLWLLAIASVGSGAFHPAGTMQATLTGRRVLKGRETTTAAYFFLFGQLGLFFGPLLAGLILAQIGVKGMLSVCLITLPVAFFGTRTLPGSGDLDAKNDQIERKNRKRVKRAGWVLVAFALVAAFQSWVQQNVVTFLPKFLSDLGQSPLQYGLISSIFMGGSALGNVIAGNLADRYGRRRVASAALIMAVFPVAAISVSGNSAWLYLIVPLAGAFTGATHSIIVVLGQRLIPSGMGLASGLILGFMFSAGAIGALLSGYLADVWGFPAMFLSSAVLVLAAAVLSFSLHKVDTV